MIKYTSANYLNIFAKKAFLFICTENIYFEKLEAIKIKEFMKIRRKIIPSDATNNTIRKTYK